MVNTRSNSSLESDSGSQNPVAPEFDMATFAKQFQSFCTAMTPTTTQPPKPDTFSGNIFEDTEGDPSGLFSREETVVGRTHIRDQEQFSCERRTDKMHEMLYGEPQKSDERGLEFIWRKRRLCQRLYPDWTEDNVISLIKRQMRTEYKVALGPHRYCSINELRAACIDIDELFHDTKRKNYLTPSSNSSSIKNKPKPPTPSQRELYSNRDGYLRRRQGGDELLVVPKAAIPRVIYEYHDSPTAGHPSAEETIRTIESRFFWSTLRKDVRTYVRACPICTCYKRGPQQGAAPMRPHQPTRPFEVVSDFWRAFSVGTGIRKASSRTTDRNFDLRYGRKRCNAGTPCIGRRRCIIRERIPSREETRRLRKGCGSTSHCWANILLDTKRKKCTG
ncbi:Integrase zinc binding domain [Popillia japonica]|uniref:RNA-directed DNA polymerase n=1 Tax=Popillia japonica TaxID=7064 RepID=A0AAW1KKN0_POPJA